MFYPRDTPRIVLFAVELEKFVELEAFHAFEFTILKSEGWTLSINRNDESRKLFVLSIFIKYFGRPAVS